MSSATASAASLGSCLRRGERVGDLRDFDEVDGAGFGEGGFQFAGSVAEEE